MRRRPRRADAGADQLGRRLPRAGLANPCRDSRGADSKLTKGSYFLLFVERRRSTEKALAAVIQGAYVQVVSTRSVDELEGARYHRDQQEPGRATAPGRSEQWKRGGTLVPGILVLALVACPLISAHAQPEPRLLPGQPRWDLPELPEYASPEPPEEFQLPPVAPPTGPTLAPLQGPPLDVVAFAFEGNDLVFSDAQLEAVADAFFMGPDALEAALTPAFESCGAKLAPATIDGMAASATAPPVNEAALLELRRVLSLLYVNCGYISSGAILPEPRPRDAVVRYVIVEGRLADINVYGTGRLPESYVRDRLAPVGKEPLNVEALRERFRLLLQDPLIERMDGRLGPGVELGDSVLDVDVVPAPPVALALIADNHRPPSTGAERGGMEVVMRNLTGAGDISTFSISRSSGANEVELGLGLPLTAQGSTLGLSFQFDENAVIEEPLRDLDIESESLTLAASLRHPLLRAPTRELALEASFARRHSDTVLLGRPFPFSTDATSDVSVLRLAQEWIDRSTTRVVAARSTVSLGLDVLGATESPDAADGRFLAWLGQIQLARRFPLEEAASGDASGGSWVKRFCNRGWRRWACRQGPQVILRGDVQLARDPLLPLEQFAVGGASSVRGYRENELVRDNGVAASLEARLPLLNLSLPGLGADPESAIVQLAPFVDYGAAWDEGEEEEEIYSAGVGLIWEPAAWLNAELYWAQALRKINNRNEDLQDLGLHFRIVLRPEDPQP